MAQQKINSSQFGNKFSGAETVTGDTWIDGKSILRKTFSLNVTGSGTEQIVNIGLSAPSVSNIIKIEGGFAASDGFNFYPIEYVNPAAPSIQNMQFKLTRDSGQYSFRYNTASNGVLNVTVYFTN